MVIGIVTGILTALALFLIKQLTLKVLLPIYQEIKYKGVIISGDWHFEAKGPGDADYVEFVFSIKQNAHEISGECDIRKSLPYEKATIRHELTGSLWEGYLTVNLLPKDRSRTSYGTALLKVSRGGQTLDGYLSFRDHTNDSVSSKPISLAKSEANKSSRQGASEAVASA